MSFSKNALKKLNCKLEKVINFKIEQNGESFTVVFPDQDKNVAVMIQPSSKEDILSGKLLYAMNKKEQPSYEDYAKKYLK